MEIGALKNSSLNFKGAVLSVNTASDAHGSLKKLGRFYQDFEEHKDEVILKDKKGNKNVFIMLGDWFISGGTKGYKTDKNANSNTFQIKFYNALMEKLKSLSKNITTFFVPGNHEFDGGAEEFVRVCDNIDSEIIMSNLNFNASPLLKGLIAKNKIVQNKILEIEDDKDPNLKHKALFVGINPVNMAYYSPGMEGIEFINNPFKAEKTVVPEEYKETFFAVIKQIKDFKEENPKGLVIVSAHTGAGFSQNLAKVLGEDINIIFNAHEHKDDDTPEVVNGVPIVELHQNLEKYVNAKFTIDDDGNLKDGVEITPYRPFENKKSSEGTFFQKLYEKVFEKDLAKEYKITTQNPEVTVLSNRHVRSTNSFLANFITDSILSEIQKTNPEVEIFSINASAIRAPLDTAAMGGANNLQMIDTLSGCTYKDAEIYKNEITGLELTEIVLDNLLFNLIYPERNPLMHYSGLIIDKKSIVEAYNDRRTVKELSQYIRTSKDNKPINPDEIYTVANIKKFFVKSKNALIHNTMYNSAIPLNLNARELFIKHVNENKNNLDAKCDVRILD